MTKQAASGQQTQRPLIPSHRFIASRVLFSPSTMYSFNDSSIGSIDDRLSDLWPSEATVHQSRFPSSVTSLPSISQATQQAERATVKASKKWAIGSAETFVQLRRRDTLDVGPDQLWQIQQGFVKALTWDEQGCVLTLGIWGPGELVGLPLGKIEPYQLLCVTAVRVQHIPLQGGYPHNFLLNQARQSQELLNLFRCRCLENRLLDLLWWLAGRFGNEIPEGCLTGIPLTHQELADLLGSTRVTMTRMLRQLEQAGKLERLVNRQLLLKGRS